MTRSFNAFLAFILAAAVLALAGCSGNSAGTSGGQGAIAAKIVWGSGKTAAKSLATAPAGVATVRLTLTGSNLAMAPQDFAAGLGQGTLSGVPAGSGYTLTVQGLSASNTVLYVGSVGNISVQANQTTTVGPITLVPADISFTGGVKDYTTANGVALSGATITTVGLASTLGAESTATSDANGLFTINGIPSGVTFHLKISKSGFADAYSSNISLVSSSDASDRAFALYPPAQLTGWGNTTGNAVIRSRVTESVDMTNGYIGGAVVTATDAADNTTTYPVKYVDGNGQISNALPATDPANGQYVVLNVPAGHTVKVTASKSGFTFGTPTFVTHADGVSQGRPVGTATFTQSDLAGTWNLIHFYTGPGIGGGGKGWVYANATIDGSGNVTINQILDSTGGTSTDIGGTLNWALNSAGFISETGTASFSSGKLKMSSDKRVIVGVASDDPDRLLRVAVRQDGNNFTSADFAGPSNWAACSLDSGASTAWSFHQGTMQNGVLTHTSALGPFGAIDSTSRTIQVSPEGVEFLPSGSGVVLYTQFGMSFGVVTWAPGTYSFYASSILGQNVGRSNLYGGFTDFNLVNDSAPFWQFNSGSYNHATDLLSINGFLDSNGDTSIAGRNEFPGITVSSSGLVTTSTDASTNGFISLDKRFVVLTSSWNPGYTLSIWLR